METVSYMLLGILAISIAALARANELTIKPDRPNLIVWEGGELKLQCVHVYLIGVAPIRISLKKGNNDDQELKRTTVIKGSYHEDTYTFTKTNVGLDDADTYTCTMETSGTTSSLQVFVYKLPAFEDTVYKAGLSLNLSCVVTSMASQQFPNTVSWSHNNEPLADSDRYSLVNNVLQIEPLERTDMGNWTCTVVFFPGSSTDEQTLVAGSLSVLVPPMIDSFDGDQDLVQGDDLDLKCKVSGYPFPMVTWFRGDTNLSDSQTERIFTLPHGGSNSGRLRIDSLVTDDKGYYKCIASSNISNEIVSTHKSIFVKVKDKYAFVWPAIGIVIELILLFAIIWFSERYKKRNKDDKDFADTAEETPEEEAGTPESIRHRRT